MEFQLQRTFKNKLFGISKSKYELKAAKTLYSILLHFLFSSFPTSLVFSTFRYLNTGPRTGIRTGRDK